MYWASALRCNMLCMHRSQVTPTVLALRDFLREQCESLRPPEIRRWRACSAAKSAYHSANKNYGRES
jgi:hypothetical protein